METPLISIIVPIYNVKFYLEKCFNSIVNQTYKNLEILLIDDGSNDGCSELCDLLKNKDSRVSVIHKTNEGVSSARNVGLDKAKGEYISFIDPDDYVAPNFIEDLYNLITINNVLLSVCTVVNVNKCNKLEQRWPKQKNGVFSYKEYFKIRISCSLCDKLFHKSLFNELRFPTNMGCSEDEYLYFRLIYKAQRIAATSKPLYFYLQRANSLTHKYNLKIYFDIFYSHYNGIKFLLTIDVDNLVINSWYYPIWCTYAGFTKKIRRLDKNSSYIASMKNMYHEINSLVNNKLNLFNKFLSCCPHFMYMVKSITKIAFYPFISAKRKYRSKQT